MPSPISQGESGASARSKINESFAELTTKQAQLVSGENLKTVGGQSLLGSGDVSVAPSGAAGGVLAGTFPNPSFAQPMATAEDLSGKQDQLVSGVSLKTLNGQSLLGSGNIDVDTPGGGSVTSVGLVAPTGFSVSNSPITSSGSLTLAYAAGYSLPTTSKQSEWDTAFGWGNHAVAGYLGAGSIGTLVQAYSANLTSWAGLAPTAKQDVLTPGDNITIEGGVISATAGGAVDSVNGQTGEVVLTAEDVGALSEDAATSIEDAKVTPVSADQLILLDSEDAGAPKLVTVVDLLTQAGMSAAEIRDALETLTGSNRLNAAAIRNLPDTGYNTATQVRDALQTLSGSNRLDASAIRNLPTVEAGDPITVTHNGAGLDPVVGDTISITFAEGWRGSVQWRRDGVDIVGATSTDYLITLEDAGTELDPLITNLGFAGSAVAVENGGVAVPDAFAIGDWSVTDNETGNSITLTVTALPADNGSAITALQYRLDGNSAVTMTGTGTGPRTISGLTADTVYDLEIRAVNAVGSSAWSDVKQVTPTGAAAAGLTVVQYKALDTPPGWSNTTEVTLDTPATPGNALFVAVAAGSSVGDVVITDSAGNTWGEADHTTTAESTPFRFFSLTNISGSPTWVRATTTNSGSGFSIAVLEASGAGTSPAEVEASGSFDYTGALTSRAISYSPSVPDTVLMFFGSAGNEGVVATGEAPVVAVSLDGGWWYAGYAGVASAGLQTLRVHYDPTTNSSMAWLAWKAGT